MDKPPGFLRCVMYHRHTAVPFKECACYPLEMSEKTISEIRMFKNEAEQKLTDFIHATADQFYADTGLKVKDVVFIEGHAGPVVKMKVDFEL